MTEVEVVAEVLVPKKTAIAIIDNDKNTQLHYSASSGTLEEVEKDLKTHSKIDMENYLGWTPLMMACRNGRLEVVKLLLERRANATKKNRFGFSVFMVSIASGNIEIITIILQHLLCGGVSRQSMQRFFSPISLAVLCSHKSIISYLVEQNFDINAATPLTGITPLMFASAMENSHAMTILLEKGADPILKNYLGLTAKDITELKTKKLEPQVDATQKEIHKSYYHQPHANQPYLQQIQQHEQQQIPMIVLSAHTPQQSFYQYPMNPVMANFSTRKSSDVMTPNFYTPPNITPMTPYAYMPQMFFPPDFSPGQLMQSPMQNVYHGPEYEYLNYRLNPNTFISPFPQHNQMMNFHSPCV